MEHLQAPRSPIFEVQVSEHSAINNTFLHITEAIPDIYKHQHCQGLVKGVLILFK